MGPKIKELARSRSPPIVIYKPNAKHHTIDRMLATMIIGRQGNTQRLLGLRMLLATRSSLFLSFDTSSWTEMATTTTNFIFIRPDIM